MFGRLNHTLSWLHHHFGIFLVHVITMSSPCHHHEVWPSLRVSLALARSLALAAAHPETLALPGPMRRHGVFLNRGTPEPLLVGGIPTPPKNMKVNMKVNGVGMTSHIYEMENKTCLKPPTRVVSILKWPHDLDDWGGTPYE